MPDAAVVILVRNCSGLVHKFCYAVMKSLHCFIAGCLIVGVSSSCKKCFPSEFLWGVASSSYQVEGAWNISGKGDSIWDWFTHTYPEKIIDRTNGDVTTDSYHRYEEDLELLTNLGVKFYRFSINWPRILPDGTVNNVNQEGVDYYLNLLKKLKEKNIEPVVTLYHWELPLTLNQQGGWTNSTTSDHFAAYASLCYKLFGMYVKYWLTINEPYIHCYVGYGIGLHAPGYMESGTLTYSCFYTLLLAHAKAYRSYNETFKATQNGEVGIVLVSQWYEPLTDSEEDKIAAENVLQWEMGLGAHPILKGNWPQVVIDRVGNVSAAQGFNKSRLPELTDEEIDLIKGTYDYIGLNYYTTQYATPISNEPPNENTPVSYDVDRNALLFNNENWPVSAASWLRDYPEGIRRLLNWMSNNYGNPRIMITENGWATKTKGGLNDTGGITYLRGHLCNLLKAKYLDGVDVFGYTYWSLINSFEWESGYTIGFGLAEVDFSGNLTRTPKDLFYYYKNITKSNCLDYCPFK